MKALYVALALSDEATPIRLRDDRFWPKVGLIIDLPPLGQMWDIFEIRFQYILAHRSGKSLAFVPSGANLTHFELKCDTSDQDRLDYCSKYYLFIWQCTH